MVIGGLGIVAPPPPNAQQRVHGAQLLPHGLLQGHRDPLPALVLELPLKALLQLSTKALGVAAEEPFQKGSALWTDTR